MDSLFSQPEQASDQSLFSQKTDTISETYSTSSQADTPSVGDSVLKLPHSSQASQRLSDGTPDERLQVIPETEESPPQEDGLTGSCPPGSPQSNAPGNTTADVRKDFATDRDETRDSCCAENVPTDDVQGAEVNDGNSGLRTRDSGIYSEQQKSSTVLNDGVSNHSVELPAGALGESTHRRTRLLDDSDDDSTSDLKLPESKSGTDAEQRDSALPDGDASNLNDSLEVPPSALGGDIANKPRRIRLLDDSDDDSTSDLKPSESKSDTDAERRDSAVPDDAPNLNGSPEVPPSELGGDSANKPRRLRLLDDSDDDSTSEPTSRGVELASNSDPVRGGESGAEHSSSSLRRRICDSSDDEMVDDVAGDTTGAPGDENSCGPCVPEEDNESAGDVKKERTGRKSAKKAMEELKQIYSTSQRMARERRMLLPYHEPERLSLKDFLQQRRSAGSGSNSTCKKEEETALATLPSSSTDPLLDDSPAVLTALDGVDDQKCAEEPATTEAMPSEEQPTETSLSSNSVERLEMQHLSARRRRNLEAIAAGIVPRLSKEPVILLADDDGDQPEGVDHLLKRLVKHAKVEDSKKKKESIKTRAIVVPGVIEECSISEKQVSQRSLLKEKLLSKVRQQRNRSREQRYLQHCLDNEELPPDAVKPDDAPKSPLALADELEEEEDDFSDDNDASSVGEEENDKNSDDEDVILKHKKRGRRINPLSDDEDQEDAEETEKASAGNVEDEDDDSIGELHLEMPAFLDTEDNIDQPAMGDENCTESFLDASQVANSDKNAQTPLIRKSGAVRSFQSDEMELFSPLTGLPRTQSKNNTPQRGNASASSSFQESPVYSTLSRPRSLAFSPLTGTAGALTACRSLRRQLSEDYTKPWEGSTPAPVNPSQDMDELVGLCSGSFGARAQADEIDEDEEDDDMPEASPGEPNEEDVGNDSEVEDTPAAREQPALKLQDFFEDEAELSGSDVGSDGEDEDDDEGVLADLIAAENEKEDTDKIREEIGRFHFKQLLDEDKRELKIYQELLLEDGDLHSDGAGRQRQFRWRNSGTDELDQQPGSDGEEEAQVETEQEADATWRLQRLERRRWLQEQESTESPDTPDSASFSEQESLLRAPAAIAKQEVKFSNKPAAKKGAMCGSFLKLDSGVLGRIAERIKGAAPTEVEGSVTTKNFVFRAAEQKPQNKRPSTSQPSQESKKPKLVELSEQRELKISVFNFM